MKLDKKTCYGYTHKNKFYYLGKYVKEHVKKIPTMFTRRGGKRKTRKKVSSCLFKECLIYQT